MRENFPRRRYCRRSLIETVSSAVKPKLSPRAPGRSRGEMKQATTGGLHRIEVCNKHGEASTAVLKVRSRRMLVRPPISKQKDYRDLVLAAMHAREKSVPNGREGIDWKLLTDLPIRSRRDAVEKLT